MSETRVTDPRRNLEAVAVEAEDLQRPSAPARFGALDEAYCAALIELELGLPLVVEHAAEAAPVVRAQRMDDLISAPV